MSDDPNLIALEYLLSGSQTSLDNALLGRLNDEGARRREIMELMDRWAEKRAEYLLLDWFRKHGAELMGSVTRTVTVTELQRLSGPTSPLEDFRESLRRLVKSA